jgi:hypothetical protein
VVTGQDVPGGTSITERLVAAGSAGPVVGDPVALPEHPAQRHPAGGGAAGGRVEAVDGEFQVRAQPVTVALSRSGLVVVVTPTSSTEVV